MNAAEGLPGAFQPTDWFLAFFATTSVSWLNRLPLARFRHVSAFAYIPGARVWVWYDAHWRGTSLIFLHHDQFIGRIGDLVEGAVVLKFKRRDEGSMPLMTRFGFYCVPACKHLLGLKCVAVTPDGFYRSVIRAGGIHISGRESAAVATGPDAAHGRAEGSS